MTAEQVHPAAKTPDTATPVAKSGSWNPSTPADNQKIRNSTSCSGHPLQPTTPRGRQPRSHGGCFFCSCCVWITLIIIVIVFIAGVAVTGAILYALYRPHLPMFSVASLRLSEFNLTDTSLTSGFNLTLTARNPNRKIALVYDQISVKILCGDVGIGDGYFPGFIHGRKNLTTLQAAVSSSNSVLDGADMLLLKSIVKSGDLPVKIHLDTKFKKFGKVKAQKLRMRVTCDGINMSVVSTNETLTSGGISSAKCKVHLRFKIF